MNAQHRREQAAGYLFILPAYASFFLFLAIPVVATLTVTMFSVHRLTFDMSFVGMENFVWVLTDPRFWTTLLNTGYFVVLAVVGNVGLGLFFAILANRGLPAAVLYFVRLCFFFPVLVSFVFGALIWQFLYAPEFGLINYFLSKLGFENVHWLTDSSVAMIAIVIFDVWKNFGFYFIIFLAALQNVPREVVEAAMIDGVSRMSMFRHVTLPSIAPVLVFAVTFATIGGLQAFDSMKVLTDGGPGDSTRTVVMYTISEAFDRGDMPAGAVAATILLLAIALVVALQLTVGKIWSAR